MFTLLSISFNLDKNAIAQQNQQKHCHITFIFLSYQLQLPYLDLFPLLSQKSHIFQQTWFIQKTYTNKTSTKNSTWHYLWSKKIDDNLVHYQQSQDIKIQKEQHIRRARITCISTTTQLPYLWPLEWLSFNSFSNFMIWSRYSNSLEANWSLMVERFSSDFCNAVWSNWIWYSSDRKWTWDKLDTCD